jgi:hypothetical protein
MAKLRSALARGGAQAFSGLSQGITELQKQRLEEARIAAQRQFEMELADKAFKRAQALQTDRQRHEMGMEDSRRAAALDEKQREGRLQLGADANVPGADPSQIAARAQGLGMGDEFFPGTGSRINMPDDPRLSPAFRGKSITNFAMPIRPSGSERPPIEQLLQQAQSSQRTGLQQDFSKKMEEFEAQPYVDETGTSVVEAPDGTKRLQERTPEQQGQREATVMEIGTPAAGARAFAEARNRALGDPQIVPILGADGSTNSLARVGPSGAPDVFAAAPLTAGQQNGGGAVDGNTTARIVMAQSLMGTFKSLSENINVEARPGQTVRGGMRYLTEPMRDDQDAELFKKIGGPLASTVMSAISGAQGSEAERAAFVSMLPGFTTSKGTAKKVVAAIERMLTEASRGRRRSPGEVLAEMTMAASGGDPNNTRMSIDDLRALGAQ